MSEEKTTNNAEDGTSRYEENFDVSAPAKLVVKNICGEIKVSPTEGSQIRVVAVVDLDSGEGESTEVLIEQDDDGTVRAKTSYEHERFFGAHKPCKVHYTIEAPADTSVYIKNVSGPIDVQGLNGKHRIKAVSGSVYLADLNGEIEASTVSGKIEAKNLIGPAELNTVSGRLRVESSDIPRLRATSVSGKLVVGTPLGEGPYELKTVSGSVRLIVPDGTGCSVKANSVSGRLKTDQLNVSGHVSKRKWDVDINGGGTSVRLKSVSGSLYIVTSEGASAGAVRVHKQPREDRMDILSKVSEGDLTVEDAMAKLN